MAGFCWLVGVCLFWPVFIRIGIVKGWFAVALALIVRFGAAAWRYWFTPLCVLFVCLPVHAQTRNVDCTVTIVPGYQASGTAGSNSSDEMLTASIGFTPASGYAVEYAVVYVQSVTQGQGGDWNQVYIVAPTNGANTLGYQPFTVNLTPEQMGSHGGGVYNIGVWTYLVDNNGNQVLSYSEGVQGIVPGASTGGASYGAATSPQSAPGDLSIGIPGLGSIKLPTGWFSQIVSYGQQLASFYTGMTGVQIASSFQSLLDKQFGLSAAGVPDVNTLFQKAFHDLMTPDPAGAAQMESDARQFVNWGPVSYVEGFGSVFTPASTTTPAPPDTHTDVSRILSGQVRSGAHWHGARPSLSARDDTNGPGSAGPMAGTVNIPLMTVDVNSGTWSDTGATVPFDFSPVTSSPVFTYFRDLLGGGIYVVFVFVVFQKSFPRPTF